MSMVKTFKGRPVKRLRRTPEGILLTFVSPVPGDRGDQLTIQQEDWDRDGIAEYKQGVTKQELRERAALRS